MRKLPLIIFSFISLLLFQRVIAQPDSSRIDAGQLYLDKQLTQGIRIKGADLEKMPFTNLADALSAWSYGSYMQPENIVYVVDGNPLADANAYSIHDIEEVFLVQDASVSLNTAVPYGEGFTASPHSGQVIIALVRTRRGARPGLGLSLSAKAGVTGLPNARTSVYQQYYAGISRSAGKLDYGFSFDHVHDVWPESKGEQVTMRTPFNMDRQRINGWMSWHPDTHNAVEVHANFVWQSMDSSSTRPYFSNELLDATGHETQNLFTPWARWHGSWGGFTQDLQAGYVAGLHQSRFSAAEENATNTFYGQRTDGKGVQHTDHVFVRERVGYRLSAGDWVFEPAVNGSYEHVTDRYTYVQVFSDAINVPTSWINSAWQKGHIWLLTPSLDIHYKKALDLQGGITANLSPRQSGISYTKIVRVFPFASLGLDLLQLGRSGSKSSLKLFGSYAQRTAWSTADFTLNDLNGNNAVNYGMPVLTTVYYKSVVSPFQVPNSPDFWIWHTGASYTTASDRVQVSYSFERRNLYAALAMENTGGGFSYVQLNWLSSRHYLGIDGTIISTPGLSWRSGLHGAIWSNRAQSDLSNSASASLHLIGDNLPLTHYTSVTGGWTNRLVSGPLSFGLDMVYHIHQPVADDGVVSTGYHSENYFSVGNVYASYRLSMTGSKSLEFFVNARDVPQNNDGMVADRRWFMGAGGKLSL